MKNSVIDAVNHQIHLEFEAAFLYLNLSVEMQQYGLPGCSHWLRVQFGEECSHALRLITYMGERRVAAEVPSVAPPPCVWESPIDAFAAVLEHEKRVSASVDALVTLSRAEQDYATESIMMRYVQEQVEEENAAADIVDCMRLAEGNRAGLLRIDRRMGKRKPGQRSDIRR